MNSTDEEIAQVTNVRRAFETLSSLALELPFLHLPGRLYSRRQPVRVRDQVATLSQSFSSPRASSQTYFAPSF